MRTDLLLLCTLLLLGFAAPALAVDGVLEINQTCAVDTGCFSGDAPGFPVSIDGSAGRSYRLTGDLVIPSVNSNGILVNTPDIAIDLGGFTIIGLACVGAVTDCTPLSGTGTGVVIVAVERRSVSVRNGSIVGMGSNGVWVGRQGEVRRVQARWNRLDGIRGDRGSTVADCHVFENGDDGIDIVSAGVGSIVRDNTAQFNGANGIRASSGSVVSGNTAYQNGAIGIFTGSNTTVSGNTVYSNGAHGIVAGVGATISGNTARSNGADGINSNEGSIVSDNTVYFNADDGIKSIGSGSIISGNTARENFDNGIGSFGDDASLFDNTASDNGGAGIFVSGGDQRVERNSANHNVRGFEINSSGNIILKNTAAANSGGNYNIVAGNSHGPLVGVVGVGDISGTAGADHPWANFGY